MKAARRWGGPSERARDSAVSHHWNFHRYTDPERTGTGSPRSKTESGSRAGTDEWTTEDSNHRRCKRAHRQALTGGRRQIFSLRALVPFRCALILTPDGVGSRACGPLLPHDIPTGRPLNPHNPGGTVAPGKAFLPQLSTSAPLYRPTNRLFWSLCRTNLKAVLPVKNSNDSFWRGKFMRQLLLCVRDPRRGRQFVADRGRPRLRKAEKLPLPPRLLSKKQRGCCAYRKTTSRPIHHHCWGRCVANPVRRKTPITVENLIGLRHGKKNLERIRPSGSTKAQYAALRRGLSFQKQG